MISFIGSSLLLTLVLVPQVLSIPLGTLNGISIGQGSSIPSNLTLPTQNSSQNLTRYAALCLFSNSFGHSDVHRSSQSFSTSFPFSRDIGRDMTLYYTYTSWPSIHTSKIEALLADAITTVSRQQQRSGVDAKLITDGSGSQRFFSIGRDPNTRIPNGIVMEVVNIKPYLLTWNNVDTLMWGLLLECEWALCDFEFSVSGRRIGKGRIYKA